MEGTAPPPPAAIATAGAALPRAVGLLATVGHTPSPSVPHGRAGPTRKRVPCRSGGSEPSIGRARAPLAPITR